MAVYRWISRKLWLRIRSFQRKWMLIWRRRLYVKRIFMMKSSSNTMKKNSSKDSALWSGWLIAASLNRYSLRRPNMRKSKSRIWLQITGGAAQSAPYRCYWQTYWEITFQCPMCSDFSTMMWEVMPHHTRSKMLPKSVWQTMASVQVNGTELALVAKFLRNSIKNTAPSKTYAYVLFKTVISTWTGWESTWRKGNRYSCWLI